MESRIVFVHALSPLHAGTGQGVGVIDLPVAREKASNLPYLPGSSLKGVLRDRCTDPKTVVHIFGPDTANASDHASSVSISDARLLLFPVRSVIGTFAWVTSPYVLMRFSRDLAIAGVGKPSEIPSLGCDECLVAEGKQTLTHGGKALLEEVNLTSTDSPIALAWANWLADRLFPDDPAWRDVLVERFCIVNDDVLAFLLETGTEVFARIRLEKEAKTVAKGGLWYEEALPVETVLSGVVTATPVMATADQVFAAMQILMGRPVQLGGKATVGRGLCRLNLMGGD